MVYDVVIIGASIAGSTVARLLDKELRVLVIDKRSFNAKKSTDQGKCCGGLLAPKAQKVLAQQGLSLPKKLIMDPQVFSVMTIDCDNNHRKFYQRNYLNINRESFDKWLFEMIPSNVEIRLNTIFKGYDYHKNYYTVKIYTNNKTEIVKTKVVIGADGANSKVRNTLYKNDKVKKYVSIQKWYKSKKTIPHYVSVFDKGITDFYSWVIQKNDYTIVGTALDSGKDYKDKFNLLISRLNDSGITLGDLVKEEATKIIRPNSIRDVRLGVGSVTLVGEASGLISPSSAEGISYALKSGYLLANSINKHGSLFNKEYARECKKLKFNIQLKKYKSLFMYNRITRNLIMKTGVLSMKVNTDKNTLLKAKKRAIC